MQDPNPLVSGQGVQRMLQAGLQVDCGILQQEAEALNKGFIKRMTLGLPFVTSKLAMSLDGRTAMASGESKWITSSHSRADVQQIRAQSSAILTGINTVLADDPSLNVRINEEVTQPFRIILDSLLKMPLTAKMLSLEGQTWIFTCSNDIQKIHQLENVGCQVFQHESQENRLNLKAVMLHLGKLQINTVLVEAGAILNGALLSEQCVDEWIVYMAPCILGDQGRGLFHLPAMQKMTDKKQLHINTVRQVGSDIKFIFNS